MVFRFAGYCCLFSHSIANLCKDYANLASRGFLAVYPAMGWWSTRPKLERYDLPARYSLIIFIRTPQTDIDLYNAVAAQVETPVVIAI